MGTSIIPFDHVNGGSGYCKLPDGTMLQWGSDAIARAAGSNTKAVTFDIQFTATPFVTVNIGTSSPQQYPLTAGGLSSTGFTCYLYNNGSTISSNFTFFWFAIGKWK